MLRNCEIDRGALKDTWLATGRDNLSGEPLVFLKLEWGGGMEEGIWI